MGTTCRQRSCVTRAGRWSRRKLLGCWRKSAHGTPPSRRPSLARFIEASSPGSLRPSSLTSGLWFAWDTDGYLHNNKAYSLRTDLEYLAAVLNSSLMWWYMWRTIPHMKDEAFAMQAFAVEQLPMAEPSDAQRHELERLVDRLVAL